MGMFDWFPFGNKNSVEVAQKSLDKVQKAFDEAKQNLEVAQKAFNEAKEQKNPVATTETRGATTVAAPTETTVAAPTETTVAPTTTTTGGKSRRHKNKPHKKTRRPKY
jgi:hypothetical protein